MRTHFQLLSRDSRQETGETRAKSPPRSNFPASEPETGVPALRDVPAICTSPRIQLDLARPQPSTTWLAENVLRERLGFWRGDIRMRVARRGHQLESSAVFRVLAPDGRWSLESLTLRDPDDDAAVDAVLRRGVRDAGVQGARRLFTRLPGNIVLDGALRRSGFVPYVSESVFVLDDEAIADAQAAPATVRRGHPADVWGIHQLYLESVPRQVQYAEAMTSRVWEGSSPLQPGMRRASGWVLEDRGRIRGYARVSTREDQRVIHLDLLIDPTMRALTPELLAAAISEVRNLHGVPCVIPVPAYRQDLRQPLQDAGFRMTGEQTAWVCYTTVPARTQIVAVDLWSPVRAEPHRSRVPGLGGAGMSAVGADAQPEPGMSRLNPYEHDISS